MTKINSKQLEYQVLGNKSNPPILFLHGWGGNIDSLKPLYSLFTDRYQVYAVSLLGFGKSDNPDRFWGIDEYVEIIKEFIKQVIKPTKNRPLIIVGHSFGGNLGAVLATDKDLPVKSLVLMSPSIRRPKAKPYQKSFFTDLPELIRKLLYIPRKVYYRLRYPSSQLLMKYALEENFKKIVSDDRSDIASKIAIPTLILWSRDDSFVPVDDATWLNEHIKESKLYVFEDGDHGFPFFKPAQTAEQILNFLEKNSNGK